MKIVIVVNDINNTLPFFGDKSLLELCIEKVKKIELPIIVASYLHDALNLSQKLGIESLYVDDDTDMYSTIAGQIKEDYLMIVHPNNPFISIEHFETALQIPPEKWRGFDSMNSAYFIKGEIWDDREKLSSNMLRKIEGSINVISREKLKETGHYVGENPAFLMVYGLEALEADFETAKIIYNQKHPENKERKINIIKK